MIKKGKNRSFFSNFHTKVTSGDPKNKKLCDKVFSLLYVFQSLRKRTSKKYPKKTIFDKLCAKKRPILLQKVSSRQFLGINKVKIMSKLYSNDINQYNSVTQRL